MVNYKKLLDAVLGSIGRTDPSGSIGDAAAGFGKQVDQAVDRVKGQSPDQLLQKAKNLVAQHPGLTQAALVGLAGLMFKNRKGGLSSGLVKLGGLAVIGALAYKAIQSRTAPVTAGGAPSQGLDADDFEAAAGTRFHPVSQTEDDALLLLRTMIAAASADGKIDELERARIVKGMAEAGIDPQSSQWLEDEMASPADVDTLAEPVNDRETASQVYAAARITIDPDTLQEREFLRRLAEALDLDEPLLREIDAAVAALRKH
ncbi:tellurite resistance TerB family protein [Microvirga brassicacearum]|uniref:Tellurite resistance TerB family protein n=1 Tax=Microvirga brassicacearum TaxID=2580413 RepID=A0A5N3PGQ0_9HYPH|nr:tellurite resistance TerB family protein [Microvirga brassicacearum]KAB0268889.1 tellurite resistance TerB family protein [Microvirga brassicacearum]